MKFYRTLGLVLFLLFPQVSSSTVEVALIKVFNLELKHQVHEKQGFYFHSAIRFRNGWIHAHPERGVEYVENIGDIEFPYHEVHYYQNTNMSSLSYEDIAQYMGLPFDKDYTWTDGRIYCSELIAKVLNLPPLPFNNIEDSVAIKFGVSPDDLKDLLVERGFQRVPYGEACYFNARFFLNQ